MKPNSLWLLRGGQKATGNSGRAKTGTDGDENSDAAEQLWQRARLSAEARRAEPPSPHSLEWLSDELHDELNHELNNESNNESNSASKTARGEAAALSFGAIHTRLMTAISASTDLPIAANRGAANRSAARQGLWRSKPHFPARQLAISWALAGFVAVAAGTGGHHLGRLTIERLPADTMISEFDGSLKSGEPLPMLGQNSRATASWLGRNTGLKVHLPAPGKSGVRLIGARSHSMNGEAVAQAHYERRGVRLALYQMRAPGLGLDSFDRQTVRGRSFFVHSAGAYRLVAWRSGENVLAVVSPLQMPEAVRVAAQMRDDSDEA